MKLREWIILNSENTKTGKPLTILTTVDAPRSVAQAKLERMIPKELQCFVGLARGPIVERNRP